MRQHSTAAAVTKFDQSEAGRLRIRADAKKRYELYKHEWAKIDRLIRPLHPSSTATSSPSKSAQPEHGSPGCLP